MSKLANREDVEKFLDAHATIDVPMLHSVGDEIDEWRVVAFVGRGGSGEVYRVEHRHLGFVAAMKVLARDDVATRDRFRREARILAEHENPAFPRFLGYREGNGRPYLVTEFLEPILLPHKDRLIAEYLEKVGEGVSFLHKLGYVHRDIKPNNVMQRGSTGSPVLIDLGLVKDVTLTQIYNGASLSIVNGRMVGVGTPKFSAPEQFAGGAISPAADVHALGVLANECFKEQPPYAWRHIIRRATCSIPSQRYESVAAFLHAVRGRHLQLMLNIGIVTMALVVIALWGWHIMTVENDVASVSMAGFTMREISFRSNVVMQVYVASNDCMAFVSTLGLTNSLEKSQKRAEDQKSVPLVSFPRSGVFIGDSDVDKDF